MKTETNPMLDYARPLLAKLKAACADTYASVAVDITESSDGALTTDIKAYTGKSGWVRGATHEEVIAKARAEMRPKLLEQAASLEAEAAKLREEAAKFDAEMSAQHPAEVAS